jgi:DNA-binding XRE family transcriptional regulator
MAIDDSGRDPPPDMVEVRGTLTLYIPRYLLASPEAEQRSPDGWPLDPILFGQQLVRVRTNAQLTQKKLAKQAGCTEVTIRNIEKGRVTAAPESRRWILAVLARYTKV